MTSWVEAHAPAKINLALHVTGQRADGYHLLDSLVAFAATGDRLWLRAGAKRMLSVTGPFAEGVPTDGRNLVWRAAELAGWTGDIELQKNLPHGGGIGGGSADAAAVLRAIGHKGNGLEIGADVPVCKFGRMARMSGIGETVEPFAAFPIAEAWAVLVNPGVHVPTPAVFKALVQKSNPPMDAIVPSGRNGSDWIDWLRAQRNDLQAPAIQSAPVISDVLNALQEQAGCLLARMSGSGSTCFALFATEQEMRRAAQQIALDHTDWWCVPTRLS